MTPDEARDWLSVTLEGLMFAEHSGDAERIRKAQEAVTKAEKVLVEVTLRDEGGWRP